VADRVRLPSPLSLCDGHLYTAGATPGARRGGPFRGLLPSRSGGPGAVIHGRSAMNDALLSFDAVSREFDTPRGRIRAVDDISLDIPQGEILCLVGESGSGKTTMARMAAGLLAPTSGVVRYDGRAL